MTNEEAIKVLTEQLAYSDDVLPARLKEAYEVAINSICTISQNAKEKEKIFADFNDSLQGINSEYGLSYYLYSNIYNIGRELADKEYQQGRADAIDEYKERLLEICDCGIEQADCTGGNCYKCMDNQVDYSSIVDLANELKEKKE